MSRILIPLFLLLVVPSIVTAAESRPNIIVILADDYGVGDIQAHYPENTVPSPYLDQFVSEGMSFTDAHSPSAVCTPTRYGLLTGRYSWRTQLQEWVLAAYEPPLIAADRPTLPKMLRERDYHTMGIGKWHLGWDWPGPQEPKMAEPRNGQKVLSWDFTKPVPGGPIDRGFDEYFGVDLPNMPPFTFIENNRTVPLPTAEYDFDPTEGHVMPRTFDGSPIAPDWKFDQILPELTRRAVQHIHDRAKQEQPFFLYFSMTSPHEPVVPSEKFKDKSGIAPIADFLLETDWSAGQVIKAVDDAGIADNTIVIFTADNGHSHYTGWNELVRAGHMPSGPYRGHKGDVWEGGHRVPLVVRWPGHVAAGVKNDQMVSLTDLFATCAEVAGGELPKEGAEDSLSFLSALKQQESDVARTTLINHSNHGEFAYRHGPWKLVYRNSGKNLEASRGKSTIAELYNLEDDIAEEHNLVDEKPEMVAKLTAELQECIERGATREEITSHNDTKVRFDQTQTERWGAAAH
ncbi:sulfatase family protein [Calycomorphotria hydatis]|uniref:Arylsulfatase n=1 Tax=Calycomorphotria hydatis TaxID=2528027 RepID=A0A517T4T8_9PLAN|nr:arylsulfatase [Calycomorphotria hydatis]QDT63378.1 Arylsulfatase [Calycomorphotria hydatis]